MEVSKTMVKTMTESNKPLFEMASPKTEEKRFLVEKLVTPAELKVTKKNQDLEQLYEEVISLQKKENERLQKICVENIKNKQENEKVGKPIQKIAGDTPLGFDSISSKPEIEDFSPKFIDEKEILEQKSDNWLLQLKKKEIQIKKRNIIQMECELKSNFYPTNSLEAIRLTSSDGKFKFNSSNII